jgi:cytidyltransferase-like protein
MSTAFFPGKFHPPHIGHVQTILDILPDYDKIIVGVTERNPVDNPITTPKVIYEFLKNFFSYFPKVEVCYIKGTLIGRPNLEGLPKFDVLLSGNIEVLDWAKEMNLDYRFVARSYDFSASDIRR